MDPVAVVAVAVAPVVVVVVVVCAYLKIQGGQATP